MYNTSLLQTSHHFFFHLYIQLKAINGTHAHTSSHNVLWFKNLIACTYTVLQQTHVRQRTPLCLYVPSILKFNERGKSSTVLGGAALFGNHNKMIVRHERIKIICWRRRRNNLDIAARPSAVQVSYCNSWHHYHVTVGQVFSKLKMDKM